jgi:putative acetyltransferase
MIRPATELDQDGIDRVYLDAFGESQGREIVSLVHGLLADETAEPHLSLVAVENGALVGHVLFTRVTVEPGGRDVAARILAPLAVAPQRQGRGVGTALIREGLGRSSASGADLVFVLGHPDYYPRYGFRPASALGLDAPYPIPAAHADAWMVQELRPGVLGAVQGTVRCASALDEPRHWRE